MAKSPAFQFYPKDWFSDAKVKAMSLEAKGAYIDLLGLYWLEEGLPADTDKLARLLGVAPAKFRRLWPEIEPCFRVDGDRIFQKRMDAERSKQDAHRTERSETGKRGAEKKWNSRMAQPSNGNGSAIDQPMAKDGFAVSVLPSATATPNVGTYEQTHVPSDVRTENAIRESKWKSQRRLLDLVGQIAERTGQEPTDVMKQVTAYKRKSDDQLVTGRVNPALLTDERLEKSLGDAEAWLMELEKATVAK